jgi:hypothetical protein
VDGSALVQSLVAIHTLMLSSTTSVFLGLRSAGMVLQQWCMELSPSSICLAIWCTSLRRMPVNWWCLMSPSRFLLSSSSTMCTCCHRPACDMLLGPLSKAPRLPTSPLRRRSHSGLYSGLALASRLSNPHPGRSYIHLEPPHALPHPPRPPGTVSCLQRHPSL